MAKKETFTFSKIGSILEKLSKDVGFVIQDQSATTDYISTDIHILDAAFSTSIKNGGVPTTGITVLAAPEATGKSYLAFSICRNAQKKGYNILFIDTESATSVEKMKKFGIDENMLELVTVNVVEKINIVLNKLLEELKENKKNGGENAKMMIVIDSLGMLSSLKEKTDLIEGKNKQDMSRAKAIKSMFRTVTGDLGFLEIPMLCTNHTYETQDMFPQTIMSGGKGTYYAADHIVLMSKAKLKDGTEDELDLGQTGILVTAKMVKNRNARPKKVKFEIAFNGSQNAFIGLDFFCTAENYEKIGIAKGKEEVDKKTGEVTFTPSESGRWFVRHLGKNLTSASKLFRKEVFTPQVLDALEPIIKSYFEYGSWEDKLKAEEEYDKKVQGIEDEESESVLGVNATEFFNED